MANSILPDLESKLMICDEHKHFELRSQRIYQFGIETKIVLNCQNCFARDSRL